MARNLCHVALALLPALMGCSSSAEARQCPQTPQAPTPQASAAAGAPAPALVAPPTQGTGDLPATTATPTSSAQAEALPELKVKLTGMHIGGGPNDALTKRPFIEVIEAGFDGMRQCYRKAEEPMKGGTFGVDLRIEREGGHPTVQAIRTVMKGDAMRTCLEEAFSGLSFGKPAKGATVLSASVYFTLEP